MGVYLGIRYLLFWALPFFIAYILGEIINPIVSIIKEKTRINKTILTLGILVIFVSLIFLIGKIVVMGIFPQVQKFVGYLPFYREKCICFISNCCNFVDKGINISEGETIRLVIGYVEDSGARLSDKVVSLATSYSRKPLR